VCDDDDKEDEDEDKDNVKDNDDDNVKAGSLHMETQAIGIPRSRPVALKQAGSIAGRR
jgi:hypothetical protein